MKKFLSLLIAITIVMTSFGTVPFTVSAEEELPGYKLEPVEILGTTTDLYDPSGTRDKSFDGDTNTYAEMINDSAWVGVDLGIASQISYIRFYPRDGWTSRATGGKFQGASDPEFTDAVDLYVIETEPPAGWNTVYITDTTAYRYVRYYTAPGGYVNISEIEFYYEETDPNATPRPTPTPTPTPSPTPTPEPTATPKPTATPRPPYADDVAIWDGTYDVSWYNESDTEFHISTAEQLAGVAAIQNGTTQANDGIPGNALADKTVVLDNDIYLNNVLTWGEDGVFATEDAMTFDPIVNWSGIFDGNGCTVYGVYVDDDLSSGTNQYVGFFSHLWGGTVKNLTLSNAYVIANNPWKKIGIVAGRNQGGLIQNVHVTDSCVAGASATIGGIVGSNDTIHEGKPYAGVVDDCSTDSTVTVTFIETGVVGGIAGANNNENGLTEGISTVKNCTSSANVIGAGYMGGIVGENIALVDNCTYIDGTVASADFLTGAEVWRSAAGGITGVNKVNGEQVGRVTNCGVIGATIATQSWEAAGGVTGFNLGGSITNSYCINSTIENLYPSAGGITGNNTDQNGSVTNCYSNNNEIKSGWNNKAGIVWSLGSATNCYAPVSDTVVVCGGDVTATNCDSFDANFNLTSGGTLVDALNAWVAANEGYNAWVMGANGPEFATEEIEPTPTPVTYVAEVDGVKCESLAEAITAANGGEITLLKTIVLDEDGTIDFGGATIVADGTVDPFFRVVADVTVKNGTVKADNGTSYAFIIGSSDLATAGNLTVESGNYYGTVSVVSVSAGNLTIEGGYFEATPYNGDYRYTINCYDASYKADNATVVINGGTFYGFNPADNLAEGTKTNFAAEGYVGVDNGDGTFGVKPDYSIAITEDDKVITTGVAESAVIILASYNGIRLVDVKCVPITADVDMAIAETELVTDGTTSINAMLLKDITNIMPLCAAK